MAAVSAVLRYLEDLAAGHESLWPAPGVETALLSVPPGRQRSTPGCWVYSRSLLDSRGPGGVHQLWASDSRDPFRDSGLRPEQGLPGCRGAAFGDRVPVR